MESPRKIKSSPGPGVTIMIRPRIKSVKPIAIVSTHRTGWGNLAKKFFTLSIFFGIGIQSLVTLLRK